MTSIKSLALFAALLTAIGSWSAQATSVLWMGTDGFVDFTQIGTVGSCNNSYFTTSGWAAGGVLVGNGTSTTDPPANRAQTSTFTASGSVWIHGVMFDNTASSNVNVQTLLIRSPDGVARILLRQTATYGIFKLSTRNAAGTITDVATASAPALVTNTKTLFDLHIDYAGGAAQLYLGTTNQVINFTGSLETDAATTLNQVELMGLGSGTTGTGGVGNDCGNSQPKDAWSQIIITDTQDTRGMVLMGLSPLANGTTQNCSAGTAGNLTDSSDATVVSSATNNQICGFTTAITVPSGAWNVMGVGQSIRANRSTTGPQDFDFYTRTADGTDHLAGTTTNPALTAGNFNFIWATNPFTSAAWSTGNFVSGFNLGFKSLP